MKDDMKENDEKTCPNPHAEGSNRSRMPEMELVSLGEEEEEKSPIPHVRQFCGSICRTKDLDGEIKYCQRPAGWGTNHQGSGYCKLHGGCAPTHSISHKKYTSQIQAWKDVYEDYLNDPELLKLSPEIAKIRTLIHRYEEDYFEGKTSPVDTECYEMLMRMIDTASKVIKRADEVRKRNEYTFTADQVKSFVQELTITIRDIVNDPVKWDQIMEAMKQAKLRRNIKGMSGKDPKERAAREERVWNDEGFGSSNHVI